MTRLLYDEARDLKAPAKTAKVMDPGARMTLVQLRDVVEADLPILFEHQADPQATLMAAFPPRDWSAFAAHWAKILPDESLDKQTILFGGRVAGNIVSFDRLGEREVGYWIGREYWGQGIATRALSEFLLLVTTRPLVARVAKHNLASLRVLEKCGFKIVGEDATLGEELGDGIVDFVLKLES